jgi:Rrf2 family transcriptional regulator, repressor of oqxAB
MSTKSHIGPPWFWVAVQALVILSEMDRSCPSSAMAQDIKTHAVFLRRVMAQLVRAEIVEAREGRDGGYRLARPAKQITLAEVFLATKMMNRDEDGFHCCRQVNQDVLALVKQDLEHSSMEVLGSYTIASLLQPS